MGVQKQKVPKDELKTFADRLQRAMGAAKLTAEEISIRRGKNRLGEVGLTQVELANRMGVGQGMIADYYSAKAAPTVQNLAALAKALGVSCDYLAGVSPAMDTDPDVQAIAKKYGLSGAALETLAGIRGDYEWGAGGKPDSSRARERWEIFEPHYKNMEPAKRNEVMEGYKEDVIRFSLRRMEIINLLLSSCDIAGMFFDAIAEIIYMQSKEEERFAIPTEKGGTRLYSQTGRTLKFSIAASLCEILAEAVALNTPPETPKQARKKRATSTNQKEEG
jgi:transcriptional regulator with XRE-family HTH domain